MKKISRIEYCAGFEPLQSGMEQDEGSRILLPTEKQQEPHHHTRTVCDEAAASAEGAAGQAAVNGRPGVGGQRLGVHQ